MMLEYPATAFSPDGSGGPKACRLKLGARALQVLQDDKTAAEWEYRSLEFDHAGENGELLLITPGKPAKIIGSVTVRETELRMALSVRVPPAQRDFLIHFGDRFQTNVRRKWRNLTLAGVITVLFCGGIYWGVTSGATAWVLDHFSVKQEVAWSTKLPPAWGQFGTPLPETDPSFKAVQSILDRLKAAIPDNPGYPFKLYVIKNKEMNAMALPGGTVVVLTGLLEQADSPEEVAGVLSHEMTHVLKRHVIRQVVHNLGWRLWIGLFLGYGDFARAAEGLGKLGELSFSRSQEEEADLGAAHILARANLPIEPFIGFFKKMQNQALTADSPFKNFISDHPSNAQRMEKLEALGKELKPEKEELFTNIDWASVKAGAK
jgi:Zn-dependent protease with chaperone function